MTSRSPFWGRPLSLFVLITFAFAAGVLVERSGRLLTPYAYTPHQLEKTFAPFWETWHLVDRFYVDRQAIDPQKMTRGAIEGMLASLGDFGHTTFLTPDELQQVKSGLQGSLEGIGARLSLRNRQPTIESTIPGSPAEKEGLEAGDVLIAVDGKEVTGLPLDRVVSMVRGPAGGVVHLHVMREGHGKPLEFDIARAKVDVPDITWRKLPGVPLGHLAIENFGQQADTQLQAALAELKQQGAQALIVDLRGNPGGLKDQAVAVTSEFLRQGNVFIEQDARGERKAIAVKPGGHALDIPICVLIDGATASSAEIFAGAMQDHHRGTLVGTKTFGTGTVLEPFSLSDGSAVFLAVAEWLTPNGRQIWHQGITPDVEVNLPRGTAPLRPETETRLDAAGLAKIGDTQLRKAIELLKDKLK